MNPGSKTKYPEPNILTAKEDVLRDSIFFFKRRLMGVKDNLANLKFLVSADLTR